MSNLDGADRQLHRTVRHPATVATSGDLPQHRRTLDPRRRLSGAQSAAAASMDPAAVDFRSASDAAPLRRPA
jgi:hypothetical protein